jgi:hypothetical protein
MVAMRAAAARRYAGFIPFRDNRKQWLSGPTVIHCSGTIHATFTGSAYVSGGFSGHIGAQFTATAAATATFVCTGSLVAQFTATASASSVRRPPIGAPATLHGLSPRFIAAVTTDHRWLAKVEVRTPAGALVSDITEHVSGGSVTVDETAEIRRTCQLVLDGTPSLVPPEVITADPLSVRDMLHPAKANELWIYRGVGYPDGTSEFAQIGVFRMSKPEITDDGQSITITINGNDRAFVVSTRFWQTPYTLKPFVLGSGGNLGAAVQSTLNFLIGKIYPNIQYNLAGDYAFYGTGIPFTYPITTFGASPNSVADPMSDLITFVAAAGAELFFDISGNVVLRPITNVSTANVIDTVHFVEGENCTVTSAQRVLDETTAHNGVILYCNGPGAAGPFVVQVWDSNSSSPSYYKGPWGPVPYQLTTTLIPAGGDSFAVAQQKAFVMANAQLQLVRGTLDQITVTNVPNPALQEGDCIQVTRERMGVDEAYVIQRMTIPVDALAGMSITMRPRIQPTS